MNFTNVHLMIKPKHKQQATSGIFKVLGDQVRSEPDRIFTDPFKLAAKLGTGHFAFPFVSDKKKY